MKQRFRPGNGLEEGLFVTRLCHTGCSPARRAGNARPLGEHFKCLAKLKVVHPHHEAEDVAPDVADPAFEGLSIRIDLQAGTRVVVPRAIRYVPTTLPTKRKITSDQIDDVDGLANLFLNVFADVMQPGRFNNDSENSDNFAKFGS